MRDVWILTFMFRGLVTAAGYTMLLEQCEARARELGPDYTHSVCINTQIPSCRIYRDRSEEFHEWQQWWEKHCRRANKPKKED